MEPPSKLLRIPWALSYAAKCLRVEMVWICDMSLQEACENIDRAACFDSSRVASSPHLLAKLRALDRSWTLGHGALAKEPSVRARIMHGDGRLVSKEPQLKTRFGPLGVQWTCRPATRSE